MMTIARFRYSLPPRPWRWLIWRVFYGCGPWLLSYLVVLPAWAEPEMRVAIRKGVEQVTLGSSTAAVIRDSAGQAIAQLPGGGKH